MPQTGPSTCVRCGYLLYGNKSSACPECGLNVSLSLHKRRLASTSERHLKLFALMAAAIILLQCCLVTFLAVLVAQSIAPLPRVVADAVVFAGEWLFGAFVFLAIPGLVALPAVMPLMRTRFASRLAWMAGAMLFLHQALAYSLAIPLEPTATVWETAASQAASSFEVVYLYYALIVAIALAREEGFALRRVKRLGLGLYVGGFLLCAWNLSVDWAGVVIGVRSTLPQGLGLTAAALIYHALFLALGIGLLVGLRREQRLRRATTQVNARIDG